MISEQSPITSYQSPVTSLIEVFSALPGLPEPTPEPKQSVQEALEEQIEKIKPPSTTDGAQKKLIEELGFDPFAPVRRR